MRTSEIDVRRWATFDLLMSTLSCYRRVSLAMTVLWRYLTGNDIVFYNDHKLVRGHKQLMHACDIKAPLGEASSWMRHYKIWNRTFSEDSLCLEATLWYFRWFLFGSTNIVLRYDHFLSETICLIALLLVEQFLRQYRRIVILFGFTSLILVILVRWSVADMILNGLSLPKSGRASNSGKFFNVLRSLTSDHMAQFATTLRVSSRRTRSKMTHYFAIQEVGKFPLLQAVYISAYFYITKKEWRNVLVLLCVSLRFQNVKWYDALISDSQFRNHSGMNFVGNLLASVVQRPTKVNNDPAGFCDCDSERTNFSLK